MLGLGFGLIYVGIPAITGNLFGSTVQILPIPWLDLTPHISSADFMPAVPLNIVFDAGLILLGMVLPFWAVVGGFVGLIATWILNPLLFQMGMLSSWREGMDVVDAISQVRTGPGGSCRRRRSWWQGAPRARSRRWP